MKGTWTKIIVAGVAIGLVGCGRSDESGGHGHSHGDGEPHAHTGRAPAPAAAPKPAETKVAPPAAHGDHAHAADGSHPPTSGEHGGHAMVELKPTTVGDVQIRLAQGHGALKAGGESHLVIKLPYTDRGATTVRAWIGSEDRTQSYVGKGDYNNHADVYDIHAMAPSSLDGNTRWWVEIVKPDGYKAIGSATPLFK